MEKVSFTTDEVKPMTPQQEQLAMLGEFLSENYEFRRNVLLDEYEMRERDENPLPFRLFTREARNSLLRRIKQEGLEVDSLGQNLDEYIYSEETRQYDPVVDYLHSLPQWDGENHVGRLFGRLPGVTTEQHSFLAIWLRSVVAHWMGMDTLHGNECVVTLIGAQGCGKSTFCASILPPCLRDYYLDHLNLANKFDKEMALTNNLLINLDELDQIKASQQAELKQALSKIMVNGRPIYGRSQKARRRYASFVSTTNNLRPLNDPTGSRRYLCINIPDGKLIDNDKQIDYGQLYAQVLHELNIESMRYWFTNDEVKRIEQLNEDYQKVISLEAMIDCCFRHPKGDEQIPPMSVSEIVGELVSRYPNVSSTSNINVRVGQILKVKNFIHKRSCKGSLYYIVARQTA